MQADETYAADSLVDLGPAPPLPNKSEFGLGPPIGGGAAVPPQPFTYPSPAQPQPPPSIYPNGAAGSASAPFVYPGGATSSAASSGQIPAINSNSDKNLLGKHY